MASAMVKQIERQEGSQVFPGLGFSSLGLGPAWAAVFGGGGGRGGGGGGWAFRCRDLVGLALCWC